MDPWDCHLDFKVESDGLTATAMHEDGFQYLWKGGRTNMGINGGIYMFECKILKDLVVKMPETGKPTRSILRVGYSQPLTSLFLGDTAESWGFGGTGKKSHNNEFKDFGQKFGAGDVMGVVMDFDDMQISYTKNGEFLGVCYTNLPKSCKELGMFPHLFLKNVKVQCNFSRENRWFDTPGPDIKFLNEAPDKHCVENPVDHPESRDECEFIQMVGLPACGKTYWAQKHMQRHPRKSYLLLGTNAVIDQMKVMGLNRQRAYAERWQELITQATPVFNKMVDLAAKTPRNFILDQTNVFPKARERKLKNFMSFGTRKCICIVNDDETLEHRTQKTQREEGKHVPEHVVWDMKAAFKAPSEREGFTVIDWAEMPEQDSKEQIEWCNKQGADFKRRNPGKGKGGKPKPKLQDRRADTVGHSTKGWEEVDNKRGGRRDRSRSPRRNNSWGGGGDDSWDRGGRGRGSKGGGRSSWDDGWDRGGYKGGGRSSWDDGWGGRGRDRW